MNVRWLVALGLIVLLLGAGTYALYTYQKHRNTEKLLAMASEQAADADWKKAAASYRQYLRRNPSDLEALSAYADVLLELIKQSPEAIRDAVGTLRRLTNADPDNTDGITKLVGLYLALREFALAEEYAKRWVKQDPDAPAAVLAVARARCGQGKYSEAADGLVAAIAEMPSPVSLYPPLIVLLTEQLHRPDEAEAWLKTAQRQAPDSIEVHLAGFSLRQRQEDLRAAEEHLRRALQLAPANVAVLIPAAAFYTSRGQLDLAAELLQRAHEISPGNRRLLSARAAWALKKNAPAELAAAATELATHARDNEVGLIARAAELFLLARELDRADECIERLVTKPAVGDNLKAVINALKGTRALLDNRPYQAIAFLEAALYEQPANARVVGALALAHSETGDFETAAEMYRRVLVLTPESGNARLALARLELQAGRPGVARKHLAALPNLEGEQAYQAETVGLACDLLQSRGQEGASSNRIQLESELVRLAAVATSDPVTAKLLARSMVMIGRHDLAIDLLRSVIVSGEDGMGLAGDLGGLLANEGAFEAMGTLADDLTKRFPSVGVGHDLHLRFLGVTGRLAEGPGYLQKITTSDRVKGRLFVTLGELFLADAQVSPVLNALQEAASLLPGDVGIRRKLARLTPQLDEALAWTDQIHQAEGDAGLHWKFERAAVLLRLDQSDGVAEKAAELLRSCVADRPNWVQARLLLGDAELRGGRLEAAADSYRAAIGQQPALAKGRVGIRLVQVLKNLGRFVEADAALQPVANAHPEAPEVLRLQTEQYYRTRDIASAALTAERLLETGRDDPAWAAVTADLRLRNGNAARAEEIARSALRQHPHAPPLLWSLSQALLAQDRADEAEGLLRDSAENRSDAAHHVLLAQLLVETGRSEEAKLSLSSAVKMAPGDAQMLATCASILGKLGERAEQLTLARRVVELRGEDPGESLALARLLATGAVEAERAEALAIVRRRLEGDPDIAEALVLKAHLAATADPPDPAEAKRSLEQALSIDPRLSGATKLLATLQVRGGNPEQARETINTGLAFAPDDAGMLLASAELYSDRGDHQRALLPLRRLLELKPRAIEALRLLARVYENMNQAARGLEFLQTYLPGEDLTPDEIMVFAKLHESNADFDLAETLYREAVAKDGTSPVPYRGLVHFLARRERFETIHSLASSRRIEQPDDVQSLIIAGEVLGSKCPDPRLREVGVGWLDAIARDHPEYAAQALYRSARCYYEQQELGRAESKYLEALHLSPNEPDMVNDLAWLYSENLGRPAEAVALIERFLVGGGAQNAHLLDTHGVALTRLAQFDAAREKLAASLRLAGQTSTRTAASYHFGLVLLKEGESEEALDHIREALELNKRRGGLTPAEQNEAQRLADLYAPPESSTFDAQHD